ncbi:class III lanthipeptide [Paenibacillus profundus]|uniref:Class III lanthipeptide n=1 Tax=Paenibacillus profundus TaxID=1173085 RepID=A0ABS8YT74_9BACL|nr:class III lanthipeptide [Paenibacillus profundus]MCE5173633.1 class III lanthipeptide [Paenibacillus profundus]
MNAVLELQKLAYDTAGKGQAADVIPTITTITNTRWSLTSNFLCRQ